LKQESVFFVLLVLISPFLNGQGLFSKSFGFVSDNDVFIEINQDQYYTNGLTLSFRFLPKTKSNKLVKKIFAIEAGQYMYTPSQNFMLRSFYQDRPFAGYLFASFAMEYYYPRGLLKVVFQGGVLGKASQAENLQKWIHETFGLPPVDGWEFQIKNQVGLNVNLLYFRNIVYAMKKHLDFNLFAQARAGTVFSDVSLGFVSRIGIMALNPVFNTVLLNSNLNRGNTGMHVNELFVFVKPQLTFIAFDATIQGSMFNDKSPVTYEAKPIVASIQVGLKWATRHLDVAYSVSFLSKPIDNPIVKPHKYGSISLVYRFK